MDKTSISALRNTSVFYSLHPFLPFCPNSLFLSLLSLLLFSMLHWQSKADTCWLMRALSKWGPSSPETFNSFHSHCTISCLCCKFKHIKQFVLLQAYNLKKYYFIPSLICRLVFFYYYYSWWKPCCTILWEWRTFNILHLKKHKQFHVFTSYHNNNWADIWSFLDY